MGALYRPQKVKGRPSDVTLEKITRKSRKYNSNRMHVLEKRNDITKSNASRPCQVSTELLCRFSQLPRIFGIPR